MSHVSLDSALHPYHKKVYHEHMKGWEPYENQIFVNYQTSKHQYIDLLKTL